MTVAAFVPDPVLSRASPTPVKDFGVQSLLAPLAPAFSPDPVLSPSAAPMAPADTETLQWPLLAADGTEVEPGLVGHESSTGDALHELPSNDTDIEGAAGSGLMPLAAPPATPEPVDAEMAVWMEQRYREGFEDGLAEGARLAADGRGADHDEAPSSTVVGASVGTAAGTSRDVVLLLESLSRALQPLLLPDDAAARFEPLKRLALHLAMELVRTELSVSPRVIDALVQRSVQALQASEEAPLTIELHPSDLDLLRQAWSDTGSGLSPDAPLLQRVNWQSSPELSRGSVRARSDISTVEDLIEHRLASIVHDLRIQAGKWQLDEAALNRQIGEPTQGLEDV